MKHDRRNGMQLMIVFNIKMLKSSWIPIESDQWMRLDGFKMDVNSLHHAIDIILCLTSLNQSKYGTKSLCLHERNEHTHIHTLLYTRTFWIKTAIRLIDFMRFVAWNIFRKHQKNYYSNSTDTAEEHKYLWGKIKSKFFQT